MRVSVFGLGYVGCVTAACLAKAGHNVRGVDVNSEKVTAVNAGQSPIVEPGLGELLGEVVGSGRLLATTSTELGVAGSDLAFVCVGTPSRESGQLDVGALERVAQEIGGALGRRPKPYTVVCRSTVLPGTTESLLIPVLRATAGAAAGSVHVALNPEFMREGSSLRDFATPPFTLVGSDEPQPAALLRQLYAGVSAPFVHTSVKTAEMAKYVSNAFHALKVSFANEIADLCDRLGADAQDVMRVFRMDHTLNISEAYLRPGFAFGGSCLPKDLRALLYAARTVDLTLPVLSGILPSNEGQIVQGAARILATRKRRIGLVGLSFKPGTDDLRESPLVRLAEILIGKGCQVRILDRHVSIARLGGANRRYIEEEIPHISSLMCDSAEALLAHAEVVVIGNLDADARLVLSSLTPHHSLVDLTRSAVTNDRPAAGG